MLKSNILKLALFATGLSGIVAEYILGTLATYLLGNSVLQWTMIISVMMFSMGLGSRFTKHLSGNLLVKFIIIEFALSLFVSYTSVLSYTTAAFSEYAGFVIYALSIIIGIFIGMEIPIVIRLNDEFESLHINVSSVIEKDYYGSLLGGVFFAFIGLPYLGLTYTPFVLGMVNLIIAIMLMIMLKDGLSISNRKILNISSIAMVLIITIGAYFAQPIILFGEQRKYKDVIVYQEQSKYQKIVITQWKNDYWLYLNGNHQLSSLDELMYHEPIVHPIMKLAKHPQNILVMGGGDGCAVREILKYSSVKNITLVDLDPAMTELGMNNEILRNMNKSAFHDSKVTIINQDGYKYLDTVNEYYDVIIIDLPDPRTVELGRLYSYEFYRLCNKHLRQNGLLVTQAGSPYFATNAFNCIDKTIAEADFSTLAIHNHIITLGEWGWVIGAKNISKENLLIEAKSLNFDDIQTEWINNEAMQMMTSFGKNIYPGKRDSVRINKIHDPVLYKYYLDGNWDLY
ncbi:MAG: polyamine aminopropyltransferase [Bacteroidales bacterium]|nr:polyamine aminopropyltransferase [Bacteroidales bacterium]